MHELRQIDESAKSKINELILEGMVISNQCKSTREKLKQSKKQIKKVLDENVNLRYRLNVSQEENRALVET